MRNQISAWKKFSVAFALILAGLVASTSVSIANPVGTDSNSTVAAQVKHKLNMLSWYGVFDNLQYQVNGSEVILSGQVVSDHSVTKDDAEEAVEGISGVTKVV